MTETLDASTGDALRIHTTPRQVQHFYRAGPAHVTLATALVLFAEP